MQLIVVHKVPEGLVLPLNYHHILQAVIYRNLGNAYGYSNFVHEIGFQSDNRKFRMFTFSLIQGKYQIIGKKIRFQDEISFEVRSPECFFIRQLADNIQRNGLTYGKQHFDDVGVYLMDDTVEGEELYIRMKTPITVYLTDNVSKKTHFFHPLEEEFSELVANNFFRKYKAYYGVEPEEPIWIRPVTITEKDSFATDYKGFHIKGWKGEYYLVGERKYLDFLYQTGLGSKNSQGFGMFDVIYC